MRSRLTPCQRLHSGVAVQVMQSSACMEAARVGTGNPEMRLSFNMLNLYLKWYNDSDKILDERCLQF